MLLNMYCHKYKQVID